MKRKSRFWRKPPRWVVVIGLLAVSGLAYVIVPQLIWLNRQLTYIDAATKEASVLLGQPAEEWHTIELDGSPQSLSDYRGQVVVFDFWYSYCGWCLRSMPQIRQLAHEFKDKPVAILGINSDTDLADAQRVVDHFNLEYPVLCDKHGETSIHKQYRVTMWPTVIVLDQQGIVRHVHCGYWPTMRSILSEKIQELLAEGNGQR